MFHSSLNQVLLIFGTTSESLEIRLMDGNQSAWFYSGRVEVRLANDSWGTVCNDGFDNREASVICKMFGYQYGITVSQAHFGRGSGSIFMDDLNCIGNEMSIFDCPFGGWSRHNCDHYKDAAVYCTNDRSKFKSFWSPTCDSWSVCWVICPFFNPSLSKKTVKMHISIHGHQPRQY